MTTVPPVNALSHYAGQLALAKYRRGIPSCTAVKVTFDRGVAHCERAAGHAEAHRSDDGQEW